MLILISLQLHPSLTDAKKLGTSFAASISYKLELAANMPQPIYSRDITIGYNVVRFLMKYEMDQSGASMVSSSHPSFILVRQKYFM